jgi:hypothetical protein
MLAAVGIFVTGACFSVFAEPRHHFLELSKLFLHITGPVTAPVP